MTLRDFFNVFVGCALVLQLIQVADAVATPEPAIERPPPDFQTEHLVVLDPTPSYTLAPIPLGGTK